MTKYPPNPDSPSNSTPKVRPMSSPQSPPNPTRSETSLGLNRTQPARKGAGHFSSPSYLPGGSYVGIDVVQLVLRQFLWSRRPFEKTQVAGSGGARQEYSTNLDGDFMGGKYLLKMRRSPTRRGISRPNWMKMPSLMFIGGYYVSIRSGMRLATSINIYRSPSSLRLDHSDIEGIMQGWIYPIKGDNGSIQNVQWDQDEQSRSTVG
ncbi:hypothetical protein B0T21DRAFT_351351 [Apiosordaria backusii]|uniref:Uncharacterized protein n=1 Tax=Apiosordaria backusii TaxID=314023 RepID=A0AA40E3N6_9PEZI|nr:hypothetical protein B0T21DRAFT_351351 [Apiosordaria backusii]